MKVISSHPVKGRGVVHIVSRKANPDIVFEVGKFVLFEGRLREIRSLECSDKNGVVQDCIGVILKN